jgi:hypothetical protein
MQLATLLELANRQHPSETIHDEVYEYLSERTLGQILRQVGKLTNLPENVEQLLQRSLTERNRLGSLSHVKPFWQRPTPSR